MGSRFRCIAIVPSGGSGARFGSVTPKQYLPLLNATVLHHTLQALLSVESIEHVFVGAQKDDTMAAAIADAFDRVTVLPSAGVMRAQTVLQTLDAVQSRIARDAWVLVHDAARPCVSPHAIQRLMDEVTAHAVGGLLALPLTDTVKRANSNNEVSETVDRSTLWRAQTPQMFRNETLRYALNSVPDATDESQAIEALGLAPKLVMGEATNIKITFPEDINQAERILRVKC
jgi:2-C-methyl-D-erythritol 4-phosphate cytidylyltransferase